MSNLTNPNCISLSESECNLMAIPYTDEEPNHQNDTRDEYLANWEVVILGIMFIVSMFGNGIVILAIYLRRYDVPRNNKLSRMYFFILNLSISDIINAILNILPQLFWKITFRFQGGPILCKFVKFGQPLGPYLSSYILTATALDRYQAVCHPLIYCSSTSKRSKIMVYFAWSLSFISCIPQIIIFSYQEISPDVWDCWGTFNPPINGQRAYVTWYSVSVFILPLIVLIFTYTSICTVIWKDAGIVGEARGPQGALLRHRTVISRAKINSVKQMIAVISFYAISNSPFIASLLWVTWDPNALDSPFFSGTAFTILTLMSSLNSCVNPWIYISLNRELSKALIQRVYRDHYPARDNNYDRDRGGIGIARCESGTSTRSYASRVCRYASSILQRASSDENNDT